MRKVCSALDEGAVASLVRDAVAAVTELESRQRSGTRPSAATLQPTQATSNPAFSSTNLLSELDHATQVRARLSVSSGKRIVPPHPSLPPHSLPISLPAIATCVVRPRSLPLITPCRLAALVASIISSAAHVCVDQAAPGGSVMSWCLQEVVAAVVSLQQEVGQGHPLDLGPGLPSLELHRQVVLSGMDGAEGRNLIPG